jgi:hypothetical protein
VTVLDHAFFGADPNDPEFDLATAQAVYVWMRNDPAAHVIAKRALFHQINDDLDQVRPQVQLMIDEWGRERVAKAMPRLKRQYVDEVMAGGDGAVQEIANAVLSPIAKADFPYNLTPQQRRENQRNQRRVNGRYATMNRSVDYSTRPIPKGERGKVNNKVELNPDADEKTQQRHMMAMRQLSDMLDPIEGAGRLRNVTLNWTASADPRNPDSDDRVAAPTIPVTRTGPDGKPQTAKLGSANTYQGTSQQAFNDDWDAHMAAGHRLEDVEADFMEDFNLAGASFDTLRALGVSEESAGYMAQQPGRVNKEKFNSFTDKWNTQSAANQPRQRTYNRIQAGAEALDAILPPGVGNEVKGAVKVAAFAGKYGQNAENLIGPQIQRQSYRYRGTEKKPNAGLQADLKFLRKETRHPDGGRADELAREKFVIGSFVQDEGVQVRGRVVASSPVREYLLKTLPDPDLLELHRESGRGTPSQGIIINQRGEIASEAVGMGEDHYLPFPGRAVKQMRGGEYIRTRAFGGPTTEDFETALMGGARAFTVVSNSGTFTVKFAPDFRGARRYNDKTRRMVKQYGNLLDSLQAEVVGFEVPEDRMREIRAKAKRLNNGRAHGALYEKYVQEGIDDELEYPQLSNDAKNAVFNEALGVLGAQMLTPDGVGITEPNDYLEARLAQMQTNGDFEATRLADAIRDADSRDAEIAEQGRITVLTLAGGPKALDRYKRGVEREERNNLNATKKMRLDGKGYENALKAMKEQFPYYIVDARRIENPDTTSSKKGAPPKKQVNAPDRYYTRPGDNRPHQVRIGYHNAPNAAIGGVQAGAPGMPNNGRRKMSAASEFGRKGSSTGITDETWRSPKAADQKRSEPGQQAARAAANPKFDAERARRREEQAKKPAEVKEAEFDGWLEQQFENQAIVWNKPGAGPQMLTGAHGATVIGAMKAAANPSGPEYQKGVDFLNQLEIKDPKVKAQFDRQRRQLAGGSGSPTATPEQAAQSVKVKANTVRANPASAKRVAEAEMRVEVNYGPEYDFDRTPDEYFATYEKLMEEANNQGIQVNVDIQTEPDKFQASLVDQVAAGFKDLADAMESGNQEAATEAEARIGLLKRLSRLGRAWDDALAEDDGGTAEPGRPLTGQADAGTRDAEETGAGASYEGAMQALGQQAQARALEPQPVTNRGANDGKTIPMPKPPPAEQARNYATQLAARVQKGEQRAIEEASNAVANGTGNREFDEAVISTLKELLGDTIVGKRHRRMVRL